MKALHRKDFMIRSIEKMVTGIVSKNVCIVMLSYKTILKQRNYDRYYYDYDYDRHCVSSNCASSCASSCACACAGSGRAGCSRKNFYGTKIDCDKLKRVLSQ